MNLFRSEEHVRNWSGFKPGTEGGIVPFMGMVQLFSNNFFRRRLDPDYLSHFQEYLMEVVGASQGLGAFWALQ